jgi:hypothetical protein
MGACCCKVHTLDPQFVRDLENAVRSYQGDATGVAAVIDESGEVLALVKHAGVNADLLLTLLPAMLRSALALARTDDFQSVKLNGAYWECQIHSLPRSTTTFISISSNGQISPQSTTMESQHRQLSSIDEKVLALQRDILLAHDAVSGGKATGEQLPGLSPSSGNTIT